MNDGIPMAVAPVCEERGALPRARWARVFCRRSVWQWASKRRLAAGLLPATINQGVRWLGGHGHRTVPLRTIMSPVIGFMLVMFSATKTWVQKTLKQQGVPLVGQTTN
jgi:hypothetical protein